MLAKDLISDVIPALKTSDSGVKALNWMDIFRVSHLPIVNMKDFLGLISDKDIYDLNMAEEPIGNHKLSLFSPYVLQDQHVYEVLELVNRLKLSVVPVLDAKNQYAGVISQNDLVKYFGDLAALNQKGGIIVLEMGIRDYSLSEISRIVESNDAKILSLYISAHSDSMKVEVTLKLNRTEIDTILQTFNRFNYTVKASYMAQVDMDEFYSDRYESFLKYLSI